MKHECKSCKKFMGTTKQGCWAFNELLAWGSPCPAWTDDSEWQKKLHKQVEEYKIKKGLV